MRAAIIVIGLLLAGCVSAEEWARRDRKTCIGYGFTPGTDAFAQCLMLTAQARDANAQRAAGTASQNYWNTYNAVTKPNR